MKISILGSGSEGNATFVQSGDTRLLIDAGFSCKKIQERLTSIGEDISQINALLVTHEHIDHVRGIGVISRKFGIPIYITRESYMAGLDKLGNIDTDNVKFIEKEFDINGNMEIHPFDVMHDAARTIGFRIETLEHKTVSIATDIGYINNIIRTYFRDADIAVIESNYDLNMLMECSYPFDLKSRIKSRTGHLSNMDASKLLRDLYNDRLKKAYLAHISKESNTYDMAEDSVNAELAKDHIKLATEAVRQDVPTEIFEI